MKRTAALAILFLLFAWPGLSMYGGDPLTFLVAFTADNGRLVVVSHRGGIRLLSVPDLKEISSLLVLEKGRRLRSAAVSPNGRWLAADDDGDRLLIWNLETGEAQPSVPIARHSYPSYLFRPGTDSLVIYQGKLRIWDVKQGREEGVVKGIDNVERMSVSPDGRYLVAFGYCPLGRVRVPNVCLCAMEEKKLVAAADWEELFFEGGPKYGYWNRSPTDLVYTQDNRILLTFRTATQPASYQSRFLKPPDLQVVEKAVVEPDQQGRYPGIRSAPADQITAVSPDGRWKATASEEQKQLYLYRMMPDGPVLEKFIRIP